eukprot:5419941-Pyramimonas_sp.AAC.1
MACKIQYLDDEPMRIRDKCDIPLGLLPLAMEVLSQPAILGSENIDPHLRHPTAEPQRMTFFEVEGCNKIGLPTRWDETRMCDSRLFLQYCFHQAAAD